MDPTVSQQPQAGVPAKVEYMPPPQAVSGCPPGLEYLTMLDQVLVKQEIHLLEVLTGFECKNKFRILNSVGQQAYFAAEESSLGMRLCCGPERGFVFHILDNNNQEAFRVRREFKCCKGCFCCPCESCRYFASVEDRNGGLLGYVSNLYFCCSPVFGIFDADHNLVGEIRGPCCPFQCICGCTDDVDYKVSELGNNMDIGKIAKVWPGFLQDAFTNADNFRVTFPMDLDVKKKALMISAVFIIDMMLYESQNNDS